MKERATRDLMLDNGNDNEISKKPQWSKSCGWQKSGKPMLE